MNFLQKRERKKTRKIKETLASEFAQCQVSGQMSGKMRYSLQTWPRRAARAGVHRGSRGGPPGGQDRGCDPNHRLRHPPRWCGSGATQRNLPDCRSVIPFWGCTCRTWGKSPDFGPWDRIVVVSEGRSASRGDFSASLHSHTTWGGDAAGGWGRTRGLGPPAAPPGTRGGPPRGRPGGATSVSCTSF